MRVGNVRTIRASMRAVPTLFDPAVDYRKHNPHHSSPLFTPHPNTAPPLPMTANKILMATTWQVPGRAHCMEFDASWFLRTPVVAGCGSIANTSMDAFSLTCIKSPVNWGRVTVFADISEIVIWPRFTAVYCWTKKRRSKKKGAGSNFEPGPFNSWKTLSARHFYLKGTAMDSGQQLSPVPRGASRLQASNHRRLGYRKPCPGLRHSSTPGWSRQHVSNKKSYL